MKFSIAAAITEIAEAAWMRWVSRANTEARCMLHDRIVLHSAGSTIFIITATIGKGLFRCS